MSKGIWNNIGLKHFTTATVDNFTSNIGIKIRRLINPLLRVMYRLAVKNKIIVESYPVLDKNVPYIFVSSHSFVDDIATALAVIDRSAYVLFGTTDQLEHNPMVYAAWCNGFVYVDRTDPESRKSVIAKLERIIKSGSSVLIFPEGGLNNTENLLIQKLFAGPYYLAKRTGTKVVPISSFRESTSNAIYVNVGDPIELAAYSDKLSAMTAVRDAMSTLTYKNIEQYGTPIKREMLGSDPRFAYMEERRKVYMETKWTKDVWDEELTQYKDIADREYATMKKSMENIHLNEKNADMVTPFLRSIAIEKRYDFKWYMRKNWCKK